ncbi:UNVERIFIED_CONTAM: hypothetical protein FKN15_019565 [Acipenser sinensis]
MQIHKPVVTDVYDTLADLAIYLETHMSATPMEYSSFAANADNLPPGVKQALFQTMKQASEDTLEKLFKYQDGAQPAMPFLKAARIFNPTKMCLISHERAAYDAAISGFMDVPEFELQLYHRTLVPAVLQNMEINLHDFWASAANRVPKLAALALKYINSVTNSADAERSFSLYNLIVTDRRQGLSEESPELCVSFTSMGKQDFKHLTHSPEKI